MPKDVYTLYALNQYVKEVLALNFEVSIWIDAEISQISITNKHIYIDLVQNDEADDSTIATARATIWSRTIALLNRKHGERFMDVLKEGLAIRFLVVVNFHERYGYSLNIQDVDPAITLGVIAQQRTAILERLKEEKHLNRNNALPAPITVQRVAILSSATAAGFADFSQSLTSNRFNYHFDTTLFPIAVQGDRTKLSFIDALSSIAKDDFDCVVVIRGGGARIDLAAFDDYDIAKSIALCPLPVLTGIGHETDMSIADVVSYRHFKTPTAVAEYLIQYQFNFESKIQQIGQLIEEQMDALIQSEQLWLAAAQDRLKEAIRVEQSAMIRRWDRAQSQAQQKVALAKRSLAHHQKLLSVHDPIHILSRGFSITTDIKNGQLISTEQAQSGIRIKTQLADGSFISHIE